ncbi:PREDICTED: zinc finger CCCH domain-containing protein 18-like [Camelina sativa]|uniref:Zinc finger CCCH domain-containing protein 18-like n=1 Tax=Camelina sativa TaxID=90675 RepID=A0ABM0SLU1_CAMSA|nr:PREDICTED: zinc finger CCCH domain-containing protein 18-like [Camelina sativa]
MDNNNKSIGVNEQVLEKQIGGCMAGFFNIFDRPHLISPKRLSSSSSSSSPPSPESESYSAASERSSPLRLKSRYQKSKKSVYSTPDLLLSPSPDSPHLLTRSPPLPPPDGRSDPSSYSSPWRFSKEAPRLSLDSRAVLDAKGSLKPRPIPPDSSPSVIARLMGLEPLPQLPLQRSASESRLSRDYTFFDFHDVKALEDPARPPPPPPSAVRRKPFSDSGDFFPPDRVSRISGFQTPPNDLETLKQLLQALRLKGLLHSSSSYKHHHTRIHNHVNDESARSHSAIRSRPGTPSPRRDQASKASLKSRTTRPTLKDQRRVSRPQPLQTGRSMSSPRSIVCSQEMWKVDDDYNRQGKTLLERCDKLLHSIAEMAAADDSQPSPVSVLDASLYHEDSSPSPVMKRSLDFTAESEDESWGGSISFSSSSSSSDSEYVYISDILRASHCLPQESDIFSLLEKQQYLKGKCASRAAAQERRLIFDAVQEIVGRRCRLPPWMMVAEADKMQVIWCEYQKIRKTKSSTEAEEEDLVGYVCGVLGRDLSEDRWRDRQVDMSEAVLDIERLVFKDLIGETIRHLAFLNRSNSLRRRLLF